MTRHGKHSGFSIRGLCITRRETPRTPGIEVLREIDLEVLPGECLAIIGASGAGKSVLARSLLGLTLMEAGWSIQADQFTIAGEAMRDAHGRAWRRARGRTIGFVLQDALQSLDPLRTLEAEVGESLDIHREIASRDQAIARPQDRKTRVIGALEQAGLDDASDRLRQRSWQLSGGQRQRALIASALISNPAVLVADEPTTALDPETSARVLELLRQSRDSGTAIVLVTHDLGVVRQIADRVAVLDAGHIVETGALSQVLGMPTARATRSLLAAEPNDLTSTSPAAPAGEELMRLEHISRSFQLGKRTLRPLNDVSLRIHKGETIGVVGASGAGKTTLARIISGADRPDSGTITFSSTIDGHQPRVRMVPQDPLATFDPRWNVQQIIAEAFLDRGVTTPASRAAINALVSTSLAQVELPDELGSRHPSTLSGGQRQRVAIARALAAEPDILVCDEPVSALDMVTQAEILNLFQRLQRETGLAIIFISHDLQAVRSIADRIVEVSAASNASSGNRSD